MGWLWLSRIPRWRSGRVARQIRKAACPLLPLGGGIVARAGTEPVRSRRRARDPARRDTVLRCAADATHPAASGVRKLAHETPAVFIVFDLLAPPIGESLLPTPRVRRHAALEAFYHSVRSREALKLSPFSRDVEEAGQWLETGEAVLDGVIAKRLDGVYAVSERYSRSRSSARQIASSVGFDTNVTALRWDPFCLASTTTRVSRSRRVYRHAPYSRPQGADRKARTAHHASGF
jgi:hypothetical protein